MRPRTLALLTLIAAPALRADSAIFLTLDSNFSSDYTFYSYTDTNGQSHDSIPISPYITYLNGGGYNNALTYTFCYDFFSPTNVGQAYSGTFEQLSDPSTLEATYLVNELNSDGLINAPLATRGAISLAIWEIMNSSSTTGVSQFPTDPAAIAYEQAAIHAVQSGLWTVLDSNRYPMWVPTDPSIQRFGVVFDGEVPIPEPRTLILVGAALLALRQRRQGKPPQAGV